MTNSINQLVNANSPTANNQPDTVFNSSSIKGLESLPNINGTQSSVSSFYENSRYGGGSFYFDSTREWSDHDGCSVIATGALSSWSGTDSDISSFLSFSGTGSGCWIRSMTGIVTPQMAGAIADGRNCVLQIRAAMYAAKHVHFPEGDYGILLSSDISGIRPPNGSTFEFDLKARFVGITANAEDYSMINLQGKIGITLINPTLIGDRDDNTSTSGEFGHGINIRECKDITIYNVDSSNFWGDGIYVGEETENLKIYGGNCNNNRRQGMSITGGVNLHFNDMVFQNTNGTPPSYGVDIEPNFAETSLKNITFTRCITRNNFESRIGFGFYNINQESDVDITFTDCKSESGDVMQFLNCSGSGLISINNFRSLNSGSSGIVFNGCSLPVAGSAHIRNWNQFGNTGMQSGSALTTVHDCANINIDPLHCVVDNPDSVVASVFTDTNSLLKNFRVNLFSNAGFGKNYSKVYGNLADIELITNFDRYYNSSSNLNNNDMYNQRAYFSIFSNKDVNFLVEHTLGNRSEFEGHRLGLEVLNNHTLKFKFSNALLNPGGYSSIASTEVGAFIEIEFRNGYWNIIKEIGNWNKIV